MRPMEEPNTTYIDEKYTFEIKILLNEIDFRIEAEEVTSKHEDIGFEDIE